MEHNNTVLTLALGKLPGLGATAVDIIKAGIPLPDLFDGHIDGHDFTTAARNKIARALDHKHEAVERACEEVEFARNHGIDIICHDSGLYPQRLKEIYDPPLALFFKGNADLNARHIISVVGTRRISEYGKDLCKELCRDMTDLLPDTVIVSGLAYGVDINAHRCSLDYGLQTIGVLAHGLDRIYPSMHTATAEKMIANGGLITEYMSRTNPDKGNFVRRNRIVAGIADATIVIESAERGGALITAGLAFDCNRSVMAFPGRINDEYSKGCNDLIKQNKAQLVTSAEDVVTMLNWNAKPKSKPIERELFPELGDKEKIVYDCLPKDDTAGKSLNKLTIETSIPVGEISSILFALEMKGLIKRMAGNRFRALGL